MNIQQALQTLNEAASLAPLTRQQHAVVIEAVRVLEEALKAKTEQQGS